MPQLTLLANGSQSLSLSPQKANTRPAASSSRGFAKQNDTSLWKMHHEEEDLAAVYQRQMNDREDEKEHHSDNEGGEGGVMKGQPDGPRKRDRSPEGGGVAGSDAKRHKNAYEIKGKVATAEAAALADQDPPLDQLMRLLKERKEVEKGESVVYWMRMEDVRIDDNTALARASAKAKALEVPLVVLFVLSPGDYKIHDRSTRRIDFILRNLRSVSAKLDVLNIPFHVVSFDRRLSIPKRIVDEVLPHLRANHAFANIEYEVDELRRDIAVVKFGKEKGVDVVCLHDRLVVPPGRVKSLQGKPMSVFSPWQRGTLVAHTAAHPDISVAWAKLIDKEPSLLNMSPLPDSNDPSIRQHQHFGPLFSATPIPNHVEGFGCQDAEKMTELYPAGTEVAKELLDRFLHTKARRTQFQLVSPLSEGAEHDIKASRVNSYQTGRNLVDGDNSSRLSPYLTSGVISGRMVINEAKNFAKGKLESGRDTGIGMWVQEVAWRDFYNQVMATWPRISMGRPFLEKFSDVQWEISEEHLQAWKDGRTGFPIVDAAMRACRARGWMENRVRMVTACFLVKSLMLDWRLGEKYFMEQFIDGDLASNNGGWQWTASTGTDPQPYFRIFNTLTQSEKCDPNGDYIRYWVPELRNLKGKAVHDPSHHMPSGEFRKLGYPAPIVDHKQSRERALFRYKNVGEKEPGG